MKAKYLLSCLATCALLVSGAAHADETDGPKQVGQIRTLANGDVWATVTPAGNSLNCVFTFVVIPNSLAGKESMVSLLLASKLSQTPVNIEYSRTGSSCTMTTVYIN